MEKKKFKIEELKVQSFVTDVNLSRMKGGETGDITPNWCGGSMNGTCDTGAYCAGGGGGDGSDDPNCTMNVGCTTVTPGSQTCADQSTPYCTGAGCPTVGCGEGSEYCGGGSNGPCILAY